MLGLKANWNLLPSLTVYTVVELIKCKWIQPLEKPIESMYLTGALEMLIFLGRLADLVGGAGDS